MGDAVPKKRKTATPRKKNRQAIVIDGDLRKMIRSEARKLNMSEEDYLRLAVHFSEAIRTAAVPAGLLDGGFLTGILGNPMIMNMIKGMIGNAVTKYFNKDGSGSSKPNAAQAPSTGMGMMPHMGMPRPQMPQGMPQMNMPRHAMPGMPGGMPRMPGVPGVPGGGMMPGPQRETPEQEKNGNDFSMEGIAKMMMGMFGN